MIVLTITNVKDFMNKLLLTDVFDHFLLTEATIQTNVSYVIDGHINPEFYSTEELDELGLKDCSCLPFSMLRSNCLNMIKGKKSPAQFKFVFMLSPTNLANTLTASKSDFTPEDISGVYLNLRFVNDQLTCTSGISYKSFSLDHTFDREWDILLQKFLSNHGISYAEVS